MFWRKKSPAIHAVTHRPLRGPYPEAAEAALFAMGCFWHAEAHFWPLDGVFVTATGYGGGRSRKPVYAEVSHGRSGHAELVLVIFEPDKIDYAALLKVFWENHDPTQGARQGLDIGPQYRSGIYVHSPAQRRLAELSHDLYGAALRDAGLGPVTTEILEAPAFTFAEALHQQYVHKDARAFCGLGGTGVVFDETALRGKAAANTP